MSILAAIFGGGSSASDPGSVSSSVSSSSDSSSTRRRSAGRGSGRGKTVRQTVQSMTDSLRSDLSMGLSTFGQTGEQQAQSLREQGYSERAIQSYQERTAASAERMRQSMMSQRDDNDRPSPVTEDAPETTEPAAPEQDIGVPKGTRAAAGAAVAEAEETGRRGRRQTIGTTMKGLTTEAETRGRRSLMGLIR